MTVCLYRISVFTKHENLKASWIKYSYETLFSRLSWHLFIFLPGRRLQMGAEEERARKEEGRKEAHGRTGRGMLEGMGNGRRRYRHPFFQRKEIWGASTNQLARPLSPPKVKEAEWAAPPLRPKAPAATTTTQKHPPRVEKNGATRITMRRGRLGTGNGGRSSRMVGGWVGDTFWLLLLLLLGWHTLKNRRSRSWCEMRNLSFPRKEILSPADVRRAHAPAVQRGWQAMSQIYSNACNISYVLYFFLCSYISGGAATIVGWLLVLGRLLVVVVRSRLEYSRSA